LFEYPSLVVIVRSDSAPQESNVRQQQQARERRNSDGSSIASNTPNTPTSSSKNQNVATGDKRVFSLLSIFSSLQPRGASPAGAPPPAPEQSGGGESLDNAAYTASFASTDKHLKLKDVAVKEEDVVIDKIII